MINKRLTPIIYLIIFLALIGLTSSIFTNFSGFIIRLLIFASITSVVVGLIYFFIYHRQPNHNELKKYRQAVKQSKKRQKQKNHQFPGKKRTTPVKIASKKNNKAPHLRVIDGKKTTKKDPMTL